GQTVIATLWVAVLITPTGFAQQAPDLTEPQTPASGGWFSSLRRPYQARRLPPPNYTDSNRLDSLVRAGAIYLSLDDAIALALENNLDVEVGRYGPRIADADLLRAEAGGFIRGIQTDVQQGPSSAGSLAGTQGGGIGVGGGGRSGGGIFGGIQIQQVGTSIPNLDPVLFFNTNWLHFTQPLTSTFTTATGSNSLVQAGRGTNYGIQKAFLSGTTVGYQWNNSFLSENSPYDDFNPWVNASMTLEVRQHLLSGFRPSVNSRLIRVAKNNIRVSDLVFKQQVITTVTAIVNLYWDLVRSTTT